MKIVQIPKPPESIVTFGDLKEGEKFYHADCDPAVAGLRMKIREGGSNKYFALGIEDGVSCRDFYELRASSKVRRAEPEKAPVVDKLYFKDLKPGETFFFKGGEHPYLKADDNFGGNMVNPATGSTFVTSNDQEVVRVHAEFHHAAP